MYHSPLRSSIQRLTYDAPAPVLVIHKFVAIGLISDIPSRGDPALLHHLACYILYQ